MQKVRIEMIVPDTMDSSALLDRMQELAIELVYDYTEDDEEEIDEDEVTDAVSVEVL